MSRARGLVITKALRSDVRRRVLSCETAVGRSAARLALRVAAGLGAPIRVLPSRN
jgi:hypothetical protein